MAEPKSRGRLYLIPTPLAINEETDIFSFIPLRFSDILTSLQGIIAENEKKARQFLSLFHLPRPIQSFRIKSIDKHNFQKKDCDSLLKPLVRGEHWGLVADAGCPAVADPGSEIIEQAHANGITVKPLVGPSSILLALMASGMNGQRFVFHGYLPKEREERIKTLKKLENDSLQLDQTQIFIEAPYRNEVLFKDSVEYLSPKTLFCIAIDLNLSTEFILSQPIENWKMGESPNINKRPAIFLIFSGFRSKQDQNNIKG